MFEDYLGNIDVLNTTFRKGIRLNWLKDSYSVLAKCQRPYLVPNYTIRFYRSFKKEYAII